MLNREKRVNVSKKKYNYSVYNMLKFIKVRQKRISVGDIHVLFVHLGLLWIMFILLLDKLFGNLALAV